jgi:hypothetical protein
MKQGSEAAFQQQITNLAAYYGWRLQYHTHDSRGSQRGFPDLVLVRPPEVLFLELKTQAGRVRPEQQQWIAALTACGLEAHIVRPDDFDRIHARLARGEFLAQPLYRDEVA